MNSYADRPVAWISVFVLVGATFIVNLITLRTFDWEGNH